MIKTTVFICTHNRSKILLNSLKSFKKVKGDFKLIVIDSSDKALGDKWKGLAEEYIYCPNKKSLSIKRNIAIDNCKSEFIAFTDDDCIPDVNWILELEKGLKENVCCTGLTLPYKKSSEMKFEKTFSFSKLGSESRVIKHKLFFNVYRIGHGNNMVFRKSIFDKVGYYDKNLGVGSKGLAGEDLDIFYKILAKGYKIRYNPLAIIYHNHLVQDNEVEKIAYRNNYAANRLFLGRPNFVYVVTYFLVFIKSLVGYVFGDRKIERERLRGLLGFNWDG